VLFDGVLHTSIGSLAEDVLIVTFNGLSKNYRACGYRSGWLIVSGDKRHAKIIWKASTCWRRCACVPTCRAVRDPDRAGRLPEHQRSGRASGRLTRQRDLAHELLTLIPA